MKTKKCVIVTKESLRLMLEQANIERKKQIVGRALVAIFNRQTLEEKISDHNCKINGIGFTGCDARSGSITAKYYLKHKSLQDWQLERWLEKDRICRYHRQLNEIAISKQQ